MKPVDYAREYGHLRLLRWVETLKKGEDWSKSAPGQIVVELALCPPLKAVEKEPSIEEIETQLKIEAKMRALEESGLDADAFLAMNTGKRK
jgi:Tat protein secretion system quality control protein TatD with DNase activity